MSLYPGRGTTLGDLSTWPICTEIPRSRCGIYRLHLQLREDVEAQKDRGHG